MPVQTLEELLAVLDRSAPTVNGGASQQSSGGTVDLNTGGLSGFPAITPRQIVSLAIQRGIVGRKEGMGVLKDRAKADKEAKGKWAVKKLSDGKDYWVNETTQDIRPIEGVGPSPDKSMTESQALSALSNAREIPGGGGAQDLAQNLDIQAGLIPNLPQGVGVDIVSEAERQGVVAPESTAFGGSPEEQKADIIAQGEDAKAKGANPEAVDQRVAEALAEIDRRIGVAGSIFETGGVPAVQ